MSEKDSKERQLPNSSSNQMYITINAKDAGDIVAPSNDDSEDSILQEADQALADKGPSAQIPDSAGQPDVDSQSSNTAPSSSATGESDSSAQSATEASRSKSAEQSSLAAIQSESNSTSAERDRTFAPVYDDKYDHQPMMHIDKASNLVHQYIETAEHNYNQHLDEDEFKKHLQLLAKAQYEMHQGFSGMNQDVNHAILKLGQEISVIDDEIQETKRFNPQSQMNILIRWARTGVPTKLEELYQRFSWIANDPHFKHFMRDNHYDDKKHRLSPPDVVLTKMEKLKEQHKAAENRKVAQQTKTLGGNK